MIIWSTLLPDEISLSITAAVPPNVLLQYDLTFYRGSEIINRVPLDALFAGPLFVNIVPDYFSLVETRYVLRYLAERPGVYRTSLLLTIDLAATLFISFVAFVMMMTALGVLFVGNTWEGSFANWSQFFPVKMIVWEESHRKTEAWFIYSTFLTSVWLWFFVASRSVVRLLYFVPWCVRIANRWFALDDVIMNRPLQAMGYVIIAAASLLVVIVVVASAA